MGGCFQLTTKESDMGCECEQNNQTINTGGRLVFSAGGTPGLSDIFVMTPASLAQIAPRLGKFRVTVVIENTTTNFECKPVFQYTNDGCSWSTVQDVDGPLGFVSDTTITAWNSDTAKFTRGIRIGLRAKQTTGTNVEMGQVSLIVDFELRP